MDIFKDKKLMLKIFLRFLKEEHMMKITFKAYKLSKNIKVKSINDISHNISLREPFYSMFDMQLMPLKLNVSDDYFYFADSRYRDLIELHNKINR